jgi:hypothetical protein
MRGKRRLLVSLAVATGLVAGVAVASQSSVGAASGPIFTVMNTSETLPDGVYFRNSPSWSDTYRIYGLGVFMNERVQLECYAFGEAIGPYSNRLWYYALNVTRPVNYNGAANQGMLNGHYIDDGQPANVIDAGVPACVNNLPPVAPPPPPPPPPIGKLVTYYSGVGSAGAPQARGLGVDRDLTADGSYDGRWTPSTQCIPDSHAVSFAGKDINRLAGWSLGRLGPIYALKYLKDHNRAAAARINYVLMFDPGSPTNFGPCDYDRTNVQADSTLAWWLGLSSDNRLVIMSGYPTATNWHQSIQTAYFPAIKQAGAAARSRVLVCNYRLDHNAVYNNYAYLMTASYRLATTQGFSSCPKQGSSSVWGWNP